MIFSIAELRRALYIFWNYNYCSFNGLKLSWEICFKSSIFRRSRRGSERNWTWSYFFLIIVECTKLSAITLLVIVCKVFCIGLIAILAICSNTSTFLSTFLLVITNSIKASLVWGLKCTNFYVVYKVILAIFCVFCDLLNLSSIKAL